jgi:hypothetical protein
LKAVPEIFKHINMKTKTRIKNEKAIIDVLILGNI